MIQVSASPEFKHVSTGEINPKVSAKASKIKKKEKAQVGDALRANFYGKRGTNIVEMLWYWIKKQHRQRLAALIFAHCSS